MILDPLMEAYASESSAPVMVPQHVEVDPVVSRTQSVVDEIDHLSQWLDEIESESTTAPAAGTASCLVSIVIPVYNEAATIAEVVARVRAIPLNTEIIVVDDCSTDETRNVLASWEPEERLRVILKPRNEGKGAALRTGFHAARGDVVVVQDADLEYDPSDIPGVVEPIMRREADVVYGSRFLGAEQQDRSRMHRLINHTLTRASNLFTGLRITDMETCYKAFRREVLNGITLCQDRFGFEPEVTAKIARRGYRVRETPIRYRARGYAEGKKIGARDAFNALYCIIRYGLAD